MDVFDDILDTPYVMRKRAAPVPPDVRLGWRLAVVVLILGKSRQQKASLPKLHVLSYALTRPESRESLRAALLRPGQVLLPMSMDPVAARSLDFARGLGFVRLEGGRFHLAEKGRALLEALERCEGLLEDERVFLADVAPLATESRLQQALKYG